MASQALEKIPYPAVACVVVAYPEGHHQTLPQINNGLQEFPELFLCGKYSDGVALGDCIRRSQESAGRVRDYLAQGEGV